MRATLKSKINIWRVKTVHLLRRMMRRRVSLRWGLTFKVKKQLGLLMFNLRSNLSLSRLIVLSKKIKWSLVFSRQGSLSSFRSRRSWMRTRRSIIRSWRRKMTMRGWVGTLSLSCTTSTTSTSILFPRGSPVTKSRTTRGKRCLSTTWTLLRCARGSPGGSSLVGPSSTTWRFLSRTSNPLKTQNWRPKWREIWKKRVWTTKRRFRWTTRWSSSMRMWQIFRLTIVIFIEIVTCSSSPRGSSIFLCASPGPPTSTEGTTSSKNSRRPSTCTSS